METTLALFLSLPLIHNKTPVVLLPGNTARLTQRSVLSTCTWSTRTQKNALLIVSNSRVNLPRTDRGGNVMIRLFRLCCHNTSVCVRLLQFCWGLKNTSHLPVNAPAHPHTHTQRLYTHALIPTQSTRIFPTLPLSLGLLAWSKNINR